VPRPQDSTSWPDLEEAWIICSVTAAWALPSARASKAGRGLSCMVLSPVLMGCAAMPMRRADGQPRRKLHAKPIRGEMEQFHADGRAARAPGAVPSWA